MAPEEPRVLVAVVQMALGVAAALGLDRAALLAEAGLREPDLLDRDAYISLSQQVRLGEAIARQRPHRNIGLVSLPLVSPSMMGVLGYVVGHCATLEGALQAFVRYQNLLTDAVRWEIRQDPPSTLRVEADPALQRLVFPVEAQLGVWVVLGRQLTRVTWSPVQLRLRHHPRGPAQEFEEVFGCPVEFGATHNELQIPPEALALPITGARPELQPSLARLAQAQLETATPPSHAERVRTLLLEQLPRGLTTREQAARRLGTSPRTLARRLQAEGSSFRDVLEAVRQQLARAWLSDPGVALHEIAYLLGYSEPSAFHRSFRRWTGQTPATWRRAHLLDKTNPSLP